MNTDSRDHKTTLALHEHCVDLRARFQCFVPGLFTFADLNWEKYSLGQKVGVELVGAVIYPRRIDDYFVEEATLGTCQFNKEHHRLTPIGA